MLAARWRVLLITRRSSMHLVGSFFGSSIGRKFLMAVTGLVLVGFILGHLAGNLQIFSSADHLNGYAEFLHRTGPTLWIVRSVLLLCAIIHIWTSISLTLDNQKARGTATRYAVKHTIRATLASRTMRLTGLVVLAFVIFHLVQFSLGGIDENYKTKLAPYTLQDDYRLAGFVAVTKGTEVPDVQLMMVRGFQSPIVSAFYIIAIGLLSYHILHGLDSAFQTLGWRNHRWSSALRKFSLALATLYFLANAAIPLSILTGNVKAHDPQKIENRTASAR